MTTGYLYSPLFLAHAEEGHPESPERLEAIVRVLGETGVQARLTALEPVPASGSQIEAVHSKEHIRRIREMVARGGGHLDPDTYTNPHSLDAALLAAGAV